MVIFWIQLRFFLILFSVYLRGPDIIEYGQVSFNPGCTEQVQWVTFYRRVQIRVQIIFCFSFWQCNCETHACTEILWPSSSRLKSALQVVLISKE